MQSAMLSMFPSSNPAPSPAWAVVGGRQRMDAPEPLITRAQRGDEAAFRELFLRHRDVVARIVHRFLGSSADVEDVVQDVFVHVHRSLPSFRGDSKFTTWLYRLTVNVTKMHLRKGRSRPRVVDVPVPETSAHRPESELPDEALERHRRMEALQRALDRLSDKKRTVLVLHDLMGLPAKEIAEVVEAPVLTVRTRLFYARKEVFAALSEDAALGGTIERLLPDLPGKPEGASEERRSSPGEEERTERR